jgi:hypothetical protein
MAAGRVSAGTTFARPKACPRPLLLPARLPARRQKSESVPVPGGYLLVRANPSPARAASQSTVEVCSCGATGWEEGWGTRAAGRWR